MLIHSPTSNTTRWSPRKCDSCGKPPTASIPIYFYVGICVSIKGYIHLSIYMCVSLYSMHIYIYVYSWISDTKIMLRYWWDNILGYNRRGCSICLTHLEKCLSRFRTVSGIRSSEVVSGRWWWWANHQGHESMDTTVRSLLVMHTC